MSLHQLANEMRNAGRGNDKMLMHMTPGEVHGLQKLAMAHGGSLTINPETGLPEAGFLSSILPMIAGFALGPAGMGLMTSMQAGLAVGAVSTLATGSLQKGIMAGLGAYGGAGLGAGLGALGGAAGTGTTAAGSAAADVARNVASGAIPGSGGIVPAITQGTAGAAQSVAATQAAAGALPQYTGYLGGLEKQLTNFPGADIIKPSVTEIAPGAFRGGAAQRLVQPEVLNPGELNSISTAVTPANVSRIAPDDLVPPIGTRQLTTPTIATERFGQMPADATKQQLFRTPSPYTPQMPGDATSGRLFETQSPYTPLGGADAVDLGTSVPIEERSRIADKIIQTPKEQGKTMLGLQKATSGTQGIKDLYAAMEKDSPYSGMAAGFSALNALNQPPPIPKKAKTLIRPYSLRKDKVYDTDVGPSSSAERRYFDTEWTELEPYEAPGPEYKAAGGLASLAEGGSTLFYNEKTGKVEPKTTSSNANKVSSTGQALDEYGGYRGPYGQYYNANNQPQMWYMDPTITSKEAVLARNAAGVTLPSKTAATPPVSTVEGLNELYQEQFGRAADPSAIESYMGKGYTPEQITGFLQSSEEYAPIKERKAAEAKQATYANPTQIANIYSSVLGRTPDVEGLDYYSGQNLTPAEIKQQLMQSEEYKKRLTTPFVAPISYTGSKLSYDDIKKQLGHDPTYKEVKTAGEAFIPNRATIQGAPEYQTPEQRMGLAPTKPRDQTPDFYAMMNKRLAAQAETKANGGVIQVPNTMEMYANGGGVQGYNLGGYSDGGRLLRGPGDGVSDGIPATIGDRQPARLADGEFVIPARIVSELGNGSTEAGAKRLYAMMDRVQKARRKTVGKNKVAVNSKADKHLPA